MSMRENAVDDYGLVIPQDRVVEIALNVVDYEDDQKENLSQYDAAIDLVDTGIFQYIGEFCGEASLINDNGDDWDWDKSVSYGCDLIIYIPLKHYPSLFHKAYDSIEDVVKEIQETVGVHLPDNFDIRGNLRHIVGTYYG